MSSYIPLVVLGSLLGYIFFSITSSNRTGGRNKFDVWVSNLLDHDINTSIKFNFFDWKIHLHHWIILLVVAIFTGYRNPFIFGLCIGGILQSFLFYEDCFELMVHEWSMKSKRKDKKFKLLNLFIYKWQKQKAPKLLQPL